MRVHYWELGLYNEGVLEGRWFDIEGLTKDEHMEELQDWLAELSEKYDRLCEEWILGDVEGIPDGFYHEYGLSEELWQFNEVVSSSHLDEDIILAAMECGFEPEEAEDRYVGSYASDADFAQELTEEVGYLPEELPAWIECHIDWEGVARDLMVDHSTSRGHYFHAC
jgi:antirestriction protein